jgi:hypothetical protein
MIAPLESSPLNDKTISCTIRIFTPCEYIIQDKKNRFSLINIFDRIFLQELPINYLFKLFLSISAPIGGHFIKVTIEDPEKVQSELATLSQNIGEDGLFNLAIEGIFEFKYYGRYWFNAYVDDKFIGQTYVNINKPDKPEEK